MVDIKPWIAAILKDLAPVELSFARIGQKLPVICLTETGGSAEAVLNGQERISRIVVQLDLYARTAQETETLALQVSARLTAAGLRRSFSQLLTDGEIPRRCMRFTCGIDETDKRVLAL